MPNHIHGILAIEKLSNSSNPETTHRVVSTEAKGTLKANSLGSILGQFKSKCTSRILEINPDFSWQGRFHDRVIRNEKELDNIRAYIFYNPVKWSEDEFYVE
jgi:REP element-mobilizing transposase RayT